MSHNSRTHSTTPAVSRISFASHSDLAWLCTDGTVRQWRAARLSPPHTIPSAVHLAYTPALLSTSDKGVPRVRHLDTRTLAVRHVTAARGGEKSGVVVALSAPVPRTTTLASSIIPTTGSGGGATGADDAPEGVYAVYDAPNIRLHSYAGALLATLHADTSVLSAALCPDGSILATGDATGTLRIYNSHSDTSSTPVMLRPHRRPIICISVTRTHIVTAALDGRLAIITLSPQPSITTTCRPDNAPSKLHAVAAVDCVVAAAGDAGTLRIWALSTDGKLAQPIAVHDGHSAAVYAIGIAPDARTIATGCADGTVRLFAVPSPPRLISSPPHSNDIPILTPTDAAHMGTHTLYPIPATPMAPLPVDAVVTMSQVARRRLLFCPSAVVTLACPVCTTAYDAALHAPICSGVCGHTFACASCNDRLWATDESPSCPLCRAGLRDVAPNYELLRVLTSPSDPGGGASSEGGGGDGARENAMGSLEKSSDYIDARRLRWVEDDATIVTSLHCSVTVAGTLDGEPAAIRIARASGSTRASSIFRGAVDASCDAETRRHLARLRGTRSPHIAQLYGASRTEDGRVAVVTELPRGGTLHAWLAGLRARGERPGVDALVRLGLQLLRAVRALHEAGVCAGHAVSPRSVGLEGGGRMEGLRIKLMELGGCLTKDELQLEGGLQLTPADFVAYMAPEALEHQGDATAAAATGMATEHRETRFRRACQADMYAVATVLWQVATTLEPFEGRTAMQVVGDVVGRNERPGDMPWWIPPAMRELMVRLWLRDAELRADAVTACEILEGIPSAPTLPTGGEGDDGTLRYRVAGG